MLPVRKSKKFQKPFFSKIIEKSSKNLRKSSPTHIFWTKPLSQWSGKANKLQNPIFFQKNHRKFIEKSSKIIPNPHFLDQTPFTVVRKSKKLQTPPPLFFSKNHRKIIASKNLRKSSPTQIFWTKPLSQRSGKAKKCKPPCFFSQKIIEKSSKNLRNIFEKNILNGIILQKFIQQIIIPDINLPKIIQQIILPDINLPKIILPIFLPCSPAWNTI